MSTYVTAVTALVNNAQTATVNHMTGSSVGDVAVVYWHTYAQGTPPTTPTGWTLLVGFSDGSGDHYIFTRTLDGTETATVWSWAPSIHAFGAMGQVSYRSTPGTTTVGTVASDASGTSTGIPDVSQQGTPGATLLHFSGILSGGTSVASSPDTTLRVNYDAGSSPARAVAIGEEITPGGPTAARTITWNVANVLGAVQIMLDTPTFFYMPQVMP